MVLLNQSGDRFAESPRPQSVWLLVCPFSRRFSLKPRVVAGIIPVPSQLQRLHSRHNCLQCNISGRLLGTLALQASRLHSGASPCMCRNYLQFLLPASVHRASFAATSPASPTSHNNDALASSHLLFKGLNLRQPFAIKISQTILHNLNV